MLNLKDYSQPRIGKLTLSNLKPARTEKQKIFIGKLHKPGHLNSFLTAQNSPIITERCQTPGPSIGRADSKGRPLSALRVKKTKKSSQKSLKKIGFKQRPQFFQYLENLFIEKLVSVPLGRRKNSKSSRKQCVVNEQKATMTEFVNSELSLYDCKEDSDNLVTPKLYKPHTNRKVVFFKR